MNLSAELFVIPPAIEPVVDPAPTDTVPEVIVVPPVNEFAAVRVNNVDELCESAPLPEMIPPSV